MNWETIFNIISLIISILTLLFFSVFPSVKKTLINKSFIKIENFYNIYSYLNPCFLYVLDGTKNITLQLITQSFLAHGFPKFRYLIEKNYLDFDPFVLQDTKWVNKLTITEIWYFYRFWSKAIKKLEYIKEIINKYEYIMKIGEKRGQIAYRDCVILSIEKSSISLCPTFDYMKLDDYLNWLTEHYKESKFDLMSINKLEKNKKFMKELKSKKFSINLKFKSNFQNRYYSYSIIFENEIPVDVETFFWKNKITLDEIDRQQIIKHLNWINNVFHINAKSLLNNYPYWVRNFKL